MASAQRGRRDGNLVKITLSKGLSVTCAIYHGNAASLGRCQECGHFPEELYFLSCRHMLCMQCFHARTEYVCKADMKKTKIQQGVEHSYSLNISLHKILLECPRCHHPQTYQRIKEHIEMEHPEVFGQEAQHPPPKEQEHQKTCPEHSVKCHVCFQSVAVISYDEHINIHYEEEQRKNAAQGDEPSDPMSPEDIKRYIQNLKSRNKKFSESWQPQTNLLATIDAPTHKTKREQEPESSGKNKNEPVETAVTEAKPQDKQQQDKEKLGLQGNASSSHPPKPADPQQHEITNLELCRKEIDLLHDEIRRLKEEKTDLQTALHGLQTTVQKLGSSEEKNGKAMAKLEGELKSASTHRLELEERIQKQIMEFQAKLEGELKSASSHRLELEELIQKQRSEFQAKWEEELKSATAHRLKLEDLVEKQASKLQEAENCVRKLKTELHMDKLLPVFQHTWKLQPYSALRKSLLFNNATLSTGVLSVNTPGYQIELMISIRGDYREWRRQWLKDESSCSVPAPHLSLMLRIHKGEHDELLAWPFRNKMSLLLVNHLDEAKSELLELGSGDADSDCFKKPVRGALNPMFGFSRVISLPDLENLEEGFLFRDCIVFKFTVHRRE